MIKLLKKQVTSTLSYGMITIETRIGELKYSFTLDTSGIDGNNYQLESVLTGYDDLSDAELDEIDNLITKTLNEKK